MADPVPVQEGEPMRVILRAAGTAALLAAMTALTAVPALAGNYADATILEGGAPPPVAGEEREVRVRLLQHGVTPVDHGSVDLVARLAGSEEEITIAATFAGDGVWVASITFPSAGDWEVGVRHSAFETSPPTRLAVAEAPAGSSSWPVTLLLLVAAAAVVGIGAIASLRGRRVVAAAPRAMRLG
jgi:hypothetical protein